MKKKRSRKYEVTSAILLFVLYFVATTIAIWFNIIRSELNYSAVFAILAIAFGFGFKLVVPKRKVTLYKNSDGLVKCAKCNKAALDGKIYCKKHSAISKTFFMFKWLFLHFVVGIVYWFYADYQKRVTIPTISEETFLWSFLLPTSLTCIAILVSLYLYARLGGRESTDSTVLDIEYIDVPKTDEKDIEENCNAIKTKNEKLVTAEQTEASGIFPWNDDEEDDEFSEERSSKRGFKIAVVIISAFLAISVGLNVFFFNKSQRVEKKLSEAQVEISENQKEIKDWKWEAEYEKKRADKELSKYRRELLSAALKRYGFLYNHAACVNDTGSYYHHPDCDYFDDSSFYIYNTDLAEAKEYKPCPVCW